MLLNSLLSLLYPRICFGCGKHLSQKLEHICLQCRAALPRTNYHLYNDNPLQKIFWGRLPIEKIFSYYKFQKSGSVQNLMHHFKYKGIKEIGITVGEMYGYELKKSSVLDGVDLIVPIPIHRKKMKLRGYNQSFYFAEGLSRSTNIDHNSKILEKSVHTSSQTRKSRYDRWQNVEHSFSLIEENIPLLKNKHLLLVDDVLTTGATIEACGRKLLEVKEVRISVATMACTI